MKKERMILLEGMCDYQTKVEPLIAGNMNITEEDVAVLQNTLDNGWGKVGDDVGELCDAIGFGVAASVCLNSDERLLVFGVDGNPYVAHIWEGDVTGDGVKVMIKKSLPHMSRFLKCSDEDFEKLKKLVGA